MPAPVPLPLSRPLLIYDDKCSACKRFAFWARVLSGGWIHLAGHYYSPEAMNVKKLVFPDDYDSTQMFWLINNQGAFGARSGLIQVFKEIVRGIIKTKVVNAVSNGYQEYISADEDASSVRNNSCDHICPTGSSCISSQDTWKRLFNMLRNSKTFHHHHHLDLKIISPCVVHNKKSCYFLSLFFCRSQEKLVSHMAAS